MTRFEFDNKITLGNIITIVLSLLAVIGGWYSLKADTEQATLRLDNMDLHIREIKIEYVRKDLFNETKQKLDRIEGKLDRLIERAN